MSVLKDAHHFNVENLKIELSGQNADALKDLCQTIAAGALLNSKERSDAPKCLPETRVAVQQDIFGWVKDDEDSAQPRRMLLLTGPAGSGKTTIMNTIGEQLNADGRLAAVFFFSSFAGSLERSTKERFVTTLVYQLIQHDCLQGIKEHVLSSITNNPAILKMHLKEQMEVLILGPLRNRPALCSAPPPPEVILVDGLDECGQNIPASSGQSERNAARLSREQDQTEILQILLDALNDLAFPFRVIIASRPEPAIQHFFSTSAKDHSVEIFLDNKYNPDADITLYLTAHFSRIRRKHPHLPPLWPGEDVIATLVSNASGQMVYAATVIRFVETPSNPPRVQLDIVLRSGPNDSSGGPTPSPSDPFGPLDSLYAQIVNSTPDPTLVLKWLKAYHRLGVVHGKPTWAFNRLCEASDGDVEHLFANLAALVRVENDRLHYDAKYVFYHKSFQDFLGDVSRYSVFFAVSDEEVHEWVIDRFLEMFERRRPVTPVTPTQTVGIRLEVLELWSELISYRESLTEPYDARMVACEAAYWISHASPGANSGKRFLVFMFAISHSKCVPFLPCRRGCRRWRKPILRRLEQARNANDIRCPKWSTLFLDRYNIKRIWLGSTDLNDIYNDLYHTQEVLVVTW